MTENVNACGECGMCCKLPVFVEKSKPANEWCRECIPGTGCGIYNTRPMGCRNFECQWLSSQKTSDPLPLAMRPDHSKVIITTSRRYKSLVAFVDPEFPEAYKEPDMEQLFITLIEEGNRIIAGDAAARNQTLYEAETQPDGSVIMISREIMLSEPDANGLMRFEGNDQ